jgi:hypothetical protein
MRPTRAEHRVAATFALRATNQGRRCSCTSARRNACARGVGGGRKEVQQRSRRQHYPRLMLVHFASAIAAASSSLAGVSGFASRRPSSFAIPVKRPLRHACQSLPSCTRTCSELIRPRFLHAGLPPQLSWRLARSDEESGRESARGAHPMGSPLARTSGSPSEVPRAERRPYVYTGASRKMFRENV